MALTQKLQIITAACLISIILGLITPQQVTTKQKFHQAGAQGAVVFVDVENVRGKSGFELTHTNLIHSISIWTKSYNLQNHVSLIVDHGSAPNGYHLKDQHVSVIFAGKQMKADDVIVRDVPFCQGELGRDLLVVTADTELIQRCKRASEGGGKNSKTLQIVNPELFLRDLEDVVGDTLADMTKNGKEGEKEMKQTSDKITSDMENEITLGARLIAVETQLKNRRKRKKNMSPKKRRKLEKQSNKIRAMLGLSGPSTLHRVTDIITNDGINENDIMDSTQQMDLLQKWESIRKSSGRREMTGDRILLAEGLRRELEKMTSTAAADGNLVQPLENMNFESMDPSEAHAHYANNLIRENIPAFTLDVHPPSVSESSPLEYDFDRKDTLRLVVISDTHGCERSLTTDYFEPWLFTNETLTGDAEKESSVDNSSRTNAYIQNDGLLPEGDILLHLGDFAVDRGGKARQNALDRFDKWLSLQPHPVKIVVRGNHDPFQVPFPISKATYVSKPTTITFGKKIMAVVPYGTSGIALSKAKRSSYLLPSSCDILATHEPPHSILDKCLSGDRAGSHIIRSAVENMHGLPPKLWVCGHIHEGRGFFRHTFGTKHTTRETMVINTANANPGRANHLVHGPVVVDVSDRCGIVGGDGEQKLSKQKIAPIIQKREKKDSEEELLLAIDLGLRCGASLFDSSGKLLRYEQLRFADAEELSQRVPLLIDSWESDINSKLELETKQTEKKRVLSYLAIEGGGDLLDAWESSLFGKKEKGIQLVHVRPEEWRARLLSQKERTSGRSSKEAARLIARQVVSEFGSMGQHEGKFKTDAAESVVMGYYMANYLGWIRREPLVSRYSNGKIIVPK